MVRSMMSASWPSRPTAASAAATDRSSRPLSVPRPMHPEALLRRSLRLSSLVASRAAMLARAAMVSFICKDPLVDAGAFPLAAIARRGGEIRGAEEHQLDAFDLAHLRHLRPRFARFRGSARPARYRSPRRYARRGIGPSSRALGADAAHAFRRDTVQTPRPAGADLPFRSRARPRRRRRCRCALDQSAVELRHADQRPPCRCAPSPASARRSPSSRDAHAPRRSPPSPARA